jgi:hypothetical protein
MEHYGAKGQQIPEIAGDLHRTRQGATIQGSGVTVPIPDVVRQAAWTYFHLHENDVVLTVFVFRVKLSQLRRFFEQAFGPDPLAGR